MSDDFKRVALTGTAGLNDDPQHQLSAKLLLGVMELVPLLLRHHFGFGTTKKQLVSGGMGGIEHAAVRMWLDGLLENEFPELLLWLPAPWAPESQSYTDTGGNQWSTNPGRSCNLLHRAFSRSSRCESLHDLESVRRLGADLRISKSFAERNSKLADVDCLISFTWALGDEPDAGASKQVWTLATCPKLHISLFSLDKTLEVWRRCERKKHARGDSVVTHTKRSKVE